MNEILDDLSYSNIVKVLQGDPQKGKEMLITLIAAHAHACENAANLDLQLRQMRQRIAEIHGSIEKVLKHLPELALPLNLVSNGKMFRINRDKELLIEPAEVISTGLTSS